jgi:defect-in-organelle-trafficking protein DotD
MRPITLRLLALCASALTLSACHTTNYRTPPPYDYSPRYAEEKLAEAAYSISNSLNQLAAIEKANSPKAKLPPPPNPASIGMEDIASVDWNGPVEPLLKKLAAACGYRLKAIGRRPAIPVIVQIDIKNQPIADILRDVSYQVVKKADIVVYPRRRIIELRYLNR